MEDEIPTAIFLITDSSFYGGRGMFRVVVPSALKKLEAIFRHKIFRMLQKGKSRRR
jgi:hypothetical protein